MHQPSSNRLFALCDQRHMVVVGTGKKNLTCQMCRRSRKW